MRSLAARRYHRSAPLVLVLTLLALITGAYALFTSAPARAEEFSDAQVAGGEKIFAANCATCHGLNAEGGTVAPSLVGVGAASVDFQVGTGRMPKQASGPQAEAKPAQFNQDEIDQLAAFVVSLGGSGPAIPTAEQVDGSLGNPATGMELFRTNCAMCHGSVGGGGALTEGKFAPPLFSTTPNHIYEAMLTGPQSMPVFNNANISPEGKRDIIAYLEEQRGASPGGLTLGSLGPVSEGLWGWLLGLGLIIGITVWVGAKSS